MVSKLSYDEILKRLPKCRKEVFDVIKEKTKASNEEIAESLNKYPHQITPRTGELREMGLIELSEVGESLKSKKTSLFMAG